MFATKYTDIQEKIKFDITSGRFGRRHSKLPAFRILAAQYKVSPVTISKAMNYLRNENIIDIRGTRGAFVKKNIQVREKFNNIAVIHKSIGDQAGLYANEVLENYVSQHNMGLLTLSVAGSAQYEPSLYSSLKADGFIFMHGALSRESAKAFHTAKIPFVSLNRLDCDYVSWVDYDNEASMSEALDFLLDTRCRSIAYVGFKNNFGGLMQRLFNIYKQKMIAANCFDEKLFIAHDTTQAMRKQFGVSFVEESGRRMARYLLSLPELPDAILIHAGISYDAIIEECTMHGVDLPRQTRIVLSMEDFQEYPSDVSVSLAPFKKKVELGFELLHTLITNRRLKPEHIVLKQKLIKVL
jgi:DNA-binding LacI/PurR family transcriptional regulator